MLLFIYEDTDLVNKEYSVVVYVEFCGTTVNVIAISADRGACTSLKCELEHEPRNGMWMLTERNIKTVDSMLDSGTVMVWKSTADRDRFTALIRRRSKFRVHKNSVLLPLPVVAKIGKCFPTTSATLMEALASEGIKTEEALRKLKGR